MKKNWVRIAVLAVIACLCVKYSDTVFRTADRVLDVMSPLITGFIIAYVLDILMKKLERIYFPGNKYPWVKKTRRPVCLFSSIFIVFAAAIVLILLVVPALQESIYVLTKDIPKAFVQFQRWLSSAAAEAGFSEIQEYVNSLEINWNEIYAKLGSIVSRGIGSIFNSAFSIANVIVSFIFSGVVSVIFSVYMLFQKEKLKTQFEAAAQVYLPAKMRGRITKFLSMAHDTFTRFISGQVLEAIILGTLCGLGMFLLRLPYALMTGVIVGVSALIPVIGAYIGAILGAFMILTVEPWKALVFLIYLVILQQVEGNLIYPRVVGGSIGLPGLWVLAAVTVGGGLFGVPGMLIGVPLTATVYKWVKQDVAEKLESHYEPQGPHLFKK